MQWTDVNHKYFQAIDNPEKAYWLGFLYADGCVYETRKDVYALTVALHEKDLDILEQFKTDIKSAAKINPTKNGVGEQNNYRINIYSHELCLDLIEHGCIPRKTFKAEFPELMEELYPHFIRGYFDGDGHVSHRSGRKAPRLHISGNDAFIDGLQDYFKCRKITSYKLRNGNIFRLEVSAKKSVANFYNFIYRDATRYMNRKKTVFDKVYANTETA